MGRIGDEIARMRITKGLSQKQLAKQAGVAETFIQEVESGKRVMNDQLATRISKILGGHFGTEAPDTAEPEPVRPAPRVVSVSRNAAPARPAGEVVWSSTAGTPANAGAAPADARWSDAFGQMLRDVPVYDAAMVKQTGTRTMAVISGKVEGQPREKVFWLEAADNDMIGYRIVRGDLVFGVQTTVLTEDGFYLAEWNGQRLMRHLKALPGGMVQISCHKGAPVRDTAPAAMVRVLGRLLRVEVRLP